MMYVNLIEAIHQSKNHVEVIATVEEEGKTPFLGIADFFLMSTEQLPDDEDEICYFLEDKNLEWDLYIPNFESND